MKDILNKAIISNRNNTKLNELEIIKNIKDSINNSKDLFEQANEIDIKNNNGFNIDLKVFDTIIDRYLKEDVLINSNEEITINKDNLLYSKIYSKIGVMLVLFDGNIYSMLEMIILGILTHNTIIFNYDGYMKGTNGLLLNIIKTILNSDMFQELYPIDTKIFNNNKTINKTIIIGNSDFKDKYIKECTTALILSGYNNYDIYLENDKHIDIIEKIISMHDINLYVNSDVNIKEQNCIYVNDIDEAIAYINSDSNFSSTIFTEDSENATYFINNVNSKNVMVNASPTLNQRLDIKQEDLLLEKNIIMQNIFNKK